METKNDNKKYNDVKNEVTKFIENGRTIFTESLKEAVELTKRKSYYYEVFNSKGERIGFGIPK